MFKSAHLICGLNPLRMSEDESETQSLSLYNLLHSHLFHMLQIHYFQVMVLPTVTLSSDVVCILPHHYIRRP